MEKRDKAQPIQALIPNLHRYGIEFSDGDTVWFGRRSPRPQPTVEELEARMEAIREEIRAHDAAKNSRLGLSSSTKRGGK